MESMRKALHMKVQPRHIECFDNSNLQGTYPVASCVVFRDGKPSRREYRHFNVKTVVGPDDFASMREIVGRRYGRLLAEGAEPARPDCRGRRQRTLSAAYGVLCELGLENRIAIIGLAKRIEEVFFPNDPMPYYLDRTGEPLKVIMHLRDEAHRFGITFHRNKRSAGFVRTQARRDRGDRNQDSRPAAAPVPQRGPDTQGFGRGARRCGRNGESPQGLRLFHDGTPCSGQARRGRRSGRISDGKRRFRCLRHKSERPPQYVGLIAP